jgi:hypothetical protein
MIVCKPKPNLQIVLFALLLLAYGLTFFLFGKVLGGSSSTFWLIGSVFMLIVSLLFTVKVMMGYKTLTIDAAKGKLWVKYLFRTYAFEVQAISSWEEIQIKTFNNQVFRQIDLILGQQKVSFSEQEHIGYAQLLQFLKKQGKHKK